LSWGDHRCRGIVVVGGVTGAAASKRLKIGTTT